MARIVQHRRGSTVDHSTLIGADGEITVDRDKKTAVIHDGSTAGGFPLARADGEASDVVLSSMVRRIVVLWQTEYDALDPKDRYTLYITTPPLLDGNDVAQLELFSTIDAFFNFVP